MMRHPIDAHAGARVKMLRVQRGLSRTALAHRVGLTFQQIQKYENGSNRVSASRLVELAQAVRAPISIFFDGLVPEEAQVPAKAYREPSTLDYDIVRRLGRVEHGRVRRELSALIGALTALE